MGKDTAHGTRVDASQWDKRSSRAIAEIIAIAWQYGNRKAATETVDLLRSAVQQRSGDGHAWALEATSWLIERCKQEINDGTRHRGTTLGSYYNMRHGLIVELIEELMAQSKSNTDESRDR